MEECLRGCNELQNGILYNKGEKDVPIARGQKFDHDAEGVLRLIGITYQISHK